MASRHMPQAPCPSSSSLKWSSGPRWTMTSTPAARPRGPTRPADESSRSHRRCRTCGAPSWQTGQVGTTDRCGRAQAAARSTASGQASSDPMSARRSRTTVACRGQRSWRVATSAGTGARAASMAWSRAATMASRSAGGTTRPQTRRGRHVADVGGHHRQAPCEGLEHRPGRLSRARMQQHVGGVVVGRRRPRVVGGPRSLAPRARGCAAGGRGPSPRSCRRSRPSRRAPPAPRAPPARRDGPSRRGSCRRR